MSRTGGSFPCYLHFALKPARRKNIQFAIDHARERVKLCPDYDRSTKALRAENRTEDSIRACYRETLKGAQSFIRFCTRAETWDPVNNEDGQSQELEKLKSQKTKLEVYREKKPQGYRYFIQRSVKRNNELKVQPLQVLVQNNTSSLPENNIIAVAFADIYTPDKMMILSQKQGLPLSNEPQQDCNFNLEGEIILVPSSKSQPNPQ